MEKKLTLRQAQGNAEQNRSIRILNSFILSGIVTIVFITIITIVGDLHPPLKTWLKTVFSHHWTGKGILASLLFLFVAFLLFLAPFQSDKEKIKNGLFALFWVALICSLTILGFYLYETFLIK